MMKRRASRGRHEAGGKRGEVKMLTIIRTMSLE